MRVDNYPGAAATFNFQLSIFNSSSIQAIFHFFNFQFSIMAVNFTAVKFRYKRTLFSHMKEKLQKSKPIPIIDNYDVMDKYDGQIYIISATTISYITLRILEIFR